MTFVDQARCRQRNKGSAISEMGASLFIIIPVLFFMISAASFTTGYATLYLACQTAARQAAVTASNVDVPIALNKVRQSVLQGPFGKFGGVSGDNLTPFLESDQNGQGQFKPFVVGTAINVTGSVYRYRVVGTCNLKPLFWPMTIPMSSQATAIVEHPESLQ